MNTPQHVLDAAKEIDKTYAGLCRDKLAAIIARHPDPELARLREENERLKESFRILSKNYTNMLGGVNQLRAEVERLTDLHLINGTHKANLNDTITQLRAEVEHLGRANNYFCTLSQKQEAQLADLRRDRERLEYVRKNYAEASHYYADGDPWNEDFYGTLDKEMARDAARATADKMEGGV